MRIDSFLCIITKIDKNLCGYVKNLLEFYIWDLFDNIKHNINNNDIYAPTVEEQKKAYSSFYDKDSELKMSVGHEES